jgi:hypothetical protein
MTWRVARPVDNGNGSSGRSGTMGRNFLPDGPIPSTALPGWVERPWNLAQQGALRTMPSLSGPALSYAAKASPEPLDEMEVRSGS